MTKKILIGLVILGLLAVSVEAQFEIIDVGETTATFQWTAPGDDGAVGFATEYDIRYALTPIVDSTDWANAIQVTDEPVPDSAGTPQFYQATGLEPNTLYFFIIKAVDDNGNWSGFSNLAVVRTEDQLPPCDITDFEAVGP